MSVFVKRTLRRPWPFAIQAALICGLFLLAQIDNAARAEHSVADIAKLASAYRAEREKEILEEYFELLKIPNHASNLSDIRKNAQHIRQMLQSRGIPAQVLERSEGSPAVFGEIEVPGATRTVLFYAHYDGQPVVRENWDSDPFSPVLRTDSLERGGEEIDFASATFPIDPDVRIFARSTSDDKAPVIGLLTAYDALVANGIRPSANIKFFFEGEEEVGSPYLEGMLEEYGHLLDADVLVFCDGPIHQSGKKKVSFGVRGPVGFEVTVYGPARPLHSGHYGNYAPNPIVMLAHLITSMRDEDSRILIDGIYDDVVPPSEAELAATVELAGADQAIKDELAIGRQESAGRNYHEAVLWPALNVKGIRAGEVGALTRNAIVPTATASFGYRMVPDQTPAKLKALTEDHIRSQGYHVVTANPSAEVRRKNPKVAKVTWTSYGYGPVRTPIQSSAAKAQVSILKDLGYEDVVLIPSSGGSLPLWYFKEALGTPILMLPIANYDNNQHGENENIRIGNLWDGIEIYAAMIAKFGAKFGERLD